MCNIDSHFGLIAVQINLLKQCQSKQRIDSIVLWFLKPGSRCIYVDLTDHVILQRILTKLG